MDATGELQWWMVPVIFAWLGFQFWIFCVLCEGLGVNDRYHRWGGKKRALAIVLVTASQCALVFLALDCVFVAYRYRPMRWGVLGEFVGWGTVILGFMGGIIAQESLKRWWDLRRGAMELSARERRERDAARASTPEQSEPPSP